MTCIVGYIDKKKEEILIGGDSLEVGGLDSNLRKDPKVFKNGEFIIGFTTSFRMGQLLMSSSFDPPSFNPEKDSVYDYMITTFVDHVRDLYSNKGYLGKLNDGEERGGSFIVGFKDRLFVVDNDFQVAEYYDDWCSVGCGEDYALGALYTMKDQATQPQTKIKKALEAAEKYSAGVQSPFNIIKKSF